MLKNSLSSRFSYFAFQGDLAKKEIYPTLWLLYRDNLLPNGTVFYGYARSKLTVPKLRAKVEQYMKVKPGEETKYEEFWQLNHYVAGGYDSEHDLAALNQEISKFETEPHANRIFYLALPPSVFESITENIKATCWGNK